MARLSKADHTRIRHLVDTEGRKVTDVAAEYGCSPASLYALLNRLRRSAEPPPPAAVLEEPACAAAPSAPALDLFATVPAPAAEPPAPASNADQPRRGPVMKRGGVGAALARPGFGLAMRTAEGDENMTPFRSLDDLLSSVKPILRAAARSQDAVWFSIRPIDLSMIDVDGA
jgi:transposase-like protein